MFRNGPEGPRHTCWNSRNIAPWVAIHQFDCQRQIPHLISTIKVSYHFIVCFLSNMIIVAVIGFQSDFFLFSTPYSTPLLIRCKLSVIRVFFILFYLFIQPLILAPRLSGIALMPFTVCRSPFTAFVFDSQIGG
jgi:hypothetical protein